MSLYFLSGTVAHFLHEKVQGHGRTDGWMQSFPCGLANCRMRKGKRGKNVCKKGTKKELHMMDVRFDIPFFFFFFCVETHESLDVCMYVCFQDTLL